MGRQLSPARLRVQVVFAPFRAPASQPSTPTPKSVLVRRLDAPWNCAERAAEVAALLSLAEADEALAAALLALLWA